MKNMIWEKEKGHSYTHAKYVVKKKEFIIIRG